MGGKRIGPDVLAYLLDRSNKLVALQRMSSDLKLDERQVQQAIATLRNGQHADTIEVIQRGQVWRYTAPAQAQPEEPTEPHHLAKGDVVEVMGHTQNGDAVAGDGQGRLYRVVPL